MTIATLCECWVARPGLRAWMPGYGWSTTLTWNTHTPLSFAKLLIFLIAKHPDTKMQVLLVIIIIIPTWQLEIFVAFQGNWASWWSKASIYKHLYKHLFLSSLLMSHGPVLIHGQIQSGFRRGATKIPKGFKGGIDMAIYHKIVENIHVLFS